MKTNHSKTTKLVGVKGTVVNDKDGAYIRPAHDRKMEVNVEDPTKQKMMKKSKYP